MRAARSTTISPILDSGYTTVKAAGVEERISAAVFTKLTAANEQVSGFLMCIHSHLAR